MENYLSMRSKADKNGDRDRLQRCTRSTDRNGEKIEL